MFYIESMTESTFATAKSLFRQYEDFSFVDAATDVYRLDTATNPNQIDYS